MADSEIQEAVGEEWVVVFQGDLFNCRERLRVLLEEEVEAQIVGVDPSLSVEGMPPVMQLAVHTKDIEDAIEIFAEIWEESLTTEGLDADEIQKLQEEVVDLSQDTIICPGCQSEISEVTEEGACIECGLFLGLPDDDDDDEEDEGE